MEILMKFLSRFMATFVAISIALYSLEARPAVIYSGKKVEVSCHNYDKTEDLLGEVEQALRTEFESASYRVQFSEVDGSLLVVWAVPVAEKTKPYSSKYVVDVKLRDESGNCKLDLDAHHEDKAGKISSDELVDRLASTVVCKLNALEC